VIADFVELLIFLPILKSIEHFHRWLFVKIQNDHNSLQKKERKEIVLLSGGRGERDGDSSAPKCADYGNKWTDKRKKKEKGKREETRSTVAMTPPISNGLCYCNPFLYRLTINIHFNKKQIQVSIKKREPPPPVRSSYIRVQYTSDLLPRIISIESLFLDGFQTLNWKVCC
jgi:hypothetical protein